MTTRDKDPRGRKLIEITDEQVKQVEALAAYLNSEQIADYLGICKQTFYNLMDRNEELQKAFKRGHAKAIGAVAQNLVQQARDGNTTAAIFYLKTKAGWKEAQDINMTGEMTIKIGKEFDKL